MPKHTIVLPLDSAMLQEVSQFATANRVTRQEQIRRIIEEWLARKEPRIPTGFSTPARSEPRSNVLDPSTWKQ